ncbi:sugar ABC transporter ATP-binding protein [Devosia sp.]|uniref:sugar ABC transporter ATP-binding protein n=1 Tax=Devosia sp. TaxID=1871048 RepID=UPI001AC03476|nr:sugar ABC transporter ATP-binding protein [Devosia sp.]MBN9308560.1 sugar ABC transporter ATP-binding protein [Devosia sp.]
MSLALGEGEVLGLVGPNGAGKSTLIKIIAGADRPDAGEVFVDGGPVHFHSAHDAYAAGIRVIHQDAPLVPGFDTVENCYLGREYPRRHGMIDRAAMRERIAMVARDIAPDLPLDVPMMFLPPAERQFVRLLRAIADKGRILILDEPTAALPAEDAERFYDVLKRTRDRGTSIVLVSHRLDEIADFCGRAVVLRDGRIVARLGAGEVTPEAMIGAMGGSAVERSTRATDTSAPKVIEVEGLVAGDLTRPASLQVHAGEVMALYGLAGSGRSSLLNAIWGAIGWTGSMRLMGDAYAPRSPREAIARGVSCVPADRHRSGLFLDQNLIYNKTLPLLSSYRRIRGLPVPHTASERDAFLVAAERVSLSYREPGQLARTLSGGNQQKLIFSRWANRHSRVMLLDEPTEGVDVMAKATIKDIIRAIAADGNAVLVSTSDRDEALELGDRIAVFRQGGIVRIFSRAEASAEALSAAAQSREAA